VLETFKDIQCTDPDKEIECGGKTTKKQKDQVCGKKGTLTMAVAELKKQGNKLEVKKLNSPNKSPSTYFFHLGQSQKDQV
jgi:hypothetical protein